MAKKRGNGEGSIYFSDKLNRWVGQFTNGVKTNGTPNRKSVYGKTRKEVADKINKALNEIKEHTFVDKNNITLLDVMNKMTDEKLKSNTISARTFKRAEETIKQICKSDVDIANTPVQKLDYDMLTDFFATITSYANTTISKIYLMLNSSLKYAVKRKFLSVNPLEDIKRPKSLQANKKVEALTIDEQRNLVHVLENEESKHPYRNILALMLYTGLRIGEALALSTKDIDFENNELHIRVTLTRDQSDHVILGSSTKTYNSIRDIKINSTVIAILKDAIKKMAINKYQLIFWDKEDNTFITPNEVNMYLKRIVKKYHISEDNITNHMLRHTYATRCIEAGMTASTLAKKLGHKDISITLNTYTSVFAKFEKSEDEKLSKHLLINDIEFKI